MKQPMLSCHVLLVGGVAAWMGLAPMIGALGGETNKPNAEVTENLAIDNIIEELLDTAKGEQEKKAETPAATQPVRPAEPAVDIPSPAAEPAAELAPTVAEPAPAPTEPAPAAAKATEPLEGQVPAPKPLEPAEAPKTDPASVSAERVTDIPAPVPPAPTSVIPPTPPTRDVVAREPDALDRSLEEVLRTPPELPPTPAPQQTPLGPASSPAASSNALHLEGDLEEALRTPLQPPPPPAGPPPAPAVEKEAKAEAPPSAPILAPVTEKAEPLAPSVPPAAPASEALEQPTLPAPVAAPSEIPPAEAPASTAAPRVPEKVMDTRTAEVDLLQDSEQLRRSAYERHAKEALIEADKAFQAQRFSEATKLYKDALAALKDAGFRPENEGDRRAAEKGELESLYMQAYQSMEQGDYEAAEKFCRQALAHPLANDLAAEIARRKEKPPPPPEKPKIRWKQQDFLDAQERLGDLLRQGREHYLAGELDKAQEAFEKIIKRDPYNSEAIRMMEKVAQRKGDLATMELEYTRRQMAADVRRTWNRRDYALMESDLGEPAVARERRPAAEDPRRKAVMEKLTKIEIPEVDFRQANIQDVITFLQSASVEYDTTVPPESKERRGVNMILNLGMPGAPTPAAAPAAAPAGAEALFGAPAEGVVGAAEVPLVTFSARYISLLEALKIVCSIANLKWRIEGGVVMIVPFNAPDGPIIHRMYDVLTSFTEIAERAREELRATARGGGDFVGMGAPGTGARQMDLKELFAQMGVQWPEGSFIKHVPAIGKLMVANTENNLAIFEEKLAVLNVVPSQIEIETRFVEVQQTDLNSFGIEWGLTDDWEIAYQTDSTLPLTGRPRLIGRRNMGPTERGFTRGNRFLRDMPVGTGGSVQPDEILSLAAVLTNPEVSMILHAIEQKGNADLLSAPKVTTKSGAEATIKVVTEYIYPTEFTVTPITATTAAGVAAVAGGIVEPGAFETREVGVILSVMPEVSPEGQMINLTMTPEVVTEPIWRNYGSVYTDASGNTQTLNMEQPFFHTRTVTTQISIYNGATVVMGGMITEHRNEVDDRIPILGDIPLLGRLFRSRYDRSEKRNLLIFVTARLVDPAGKPILRRRTALVSPEAAAAASSSPAS